MMKDLERGGCPRPRLPRPARKGAESQGPPHAARRAPPRDCGYGGVRSVLHVGFIHGYIFMFCFKKILQCKVLFDCFR